MNITGIANLATDMQASRLKEQVSVSVLKKALDTQAAAAAQLLAAVPQVASASSLPANLGQNIDITA